MTINYGTTMKTNKLPQSAWSDVQAAGSQSQQISQSTTHYLNSDNVQQTGSASNDARYNSQHQEDRNSMGSTEDTSLENSCFAYKCAKNSTKEVKRSPMDSSNNQDSVRNNDASKQPSVTTGYQKLQKSSDDVNLSTLKSTNYQVDGSKGESMSDEACNSSTTVRSELEIPERIFMNSLIKHTGIALAIIIPLAAFSAYAAPMTAPNSMINKTATMTTADNTNAATLAVTPSSIIYKSATVPTTVDSVDLKRYAGKWYEIGRLPMYFQRNCARDVTATYTKKTEGSGITVLNQCTGKDGSAIAAEGLAKTVDKTGSKLKVTFLPSWIRWLPVGRADYWVLARDSDYKTALVGTPDKDYLWLLARTPNISQTTYTKYRQIAQQQGYDLREFRVTPQTSQTVTLTP